MIEQVTAYQTPGAKRSVPRYIWEAMDCAPILNFGLYLHVPYCRALCHYCDFAKTANFSAAHAERYVSRLIEDLDGWLRRLEDRGERTPFTSVFLGGGTPSLFTDLYAPLFAKIRALSIPTAEMTLEANPDDVTSDRLKMWRELGINRLSVGVQTFEDRGLRFLKRAHDSGRARDAVRAAREIMPRVNLDLIYGWPGQTAADWQADLDQALSLGVGHMSLYTLTYEPRTPIGRAALRGVLTPESDDLVADLYEAAKARLAKEGYRHEEVSNWAKPGEACRHNWGYWQDQPYVGIGAGAHGYLRSGEGPGMRYAYGRDDRAFLKAPMQYVVEAERGPDTWLADYVGAALRTCRGVDLNLVERRTGRRLEPTPLLQEAIETRIISIEPTRRILSLDPGDWFRETAWGVELLCSFMPTRHNV